MNTTDTPVLPAETAGPEHKTGPRPSDLRLRAFIIGLLLVPFDNYWVLSMEKVNKGPYPTVIALFLNTIFILAVLAALNSLVRRIAPRLTLSMAEMLVIYTMTTISAALAGHDMMPTLVACMSYPWRAATETNNWANTFLPHLPRWLSVTDPNVVKPLYAGGSSLYAHGYWRPWVLPGLWWVSFYTTLALVMMCLNTLLRKQWMEHERLTFPIVQLPIAMTEPKGEIWKSKLFWIGFGVCFGIELLNGLAIYFPSMPSFNLTERDHNLGAAIVSMPWKSVGWLPYSFHPFVIGLGYLLPADLSFSVWFFYLFWKVQKIIAGTFGMDVTFDDPYIRQQEFGGAMALVLMLLWSSKGYLKQVWLRVMDKKSSLDDRDEPLSYRGAVIGAIAGLLYLCWFMVRIGMSPLVALIAFTIYFIVAIVVTRIRAELGPPVHDMPFSADFIMTSSAGLGRFSNSDAVGLAYMGFVHGCNRSHPMPIGMEGMKMASVTRTSQRKVFVAMMLAVALGAAATVWAYLHLGYKFGLDAKWNYGPAWGWEFTKRINNWWARSPEICGPDWTGNLAMGGGFAFCLLLSYARMRIFNWPFHPMGYVISGTYQAHLVWVPLLIAWLAKVSILRYGGLKVYRQAMPLFLGMIVGQLMMGCLWGMIGMLFGIPYYSFFGA